MDDKHAMWLRAVDTLLVELFDGPPSDLAFLLNVGDMGLLRQLESLDGHAASTRPMPGQTTIAAHVDHVLYGLTLLNRAADGEPNPWATADWEASWRRTTVDDAGWHNLVARLRTAAEAWKRNIQTWSQWDDVTTPGVLSSVAHTAYHLGAIRQILAAAGQNHAPR